MEMVAQRNAATLVPLIQRHILPGTHIWSDEWAAYAGLNNAGYVHQTVNHSRHFVDPQTGVHTNNIESRWAACKASFRRHFGVPRHMLPGYIDEYMWRARRPNDQYMQDILAAIRAQYPV